MNPVSVAARREQVQRLLVKGFSAREIAGSVDPPVSEITVKRDMAWVRKQNAKWWAANSRVEARMASYLKERVDALQGVVREGWLIIAASRDDLKTRVSGLNAVLGAEKALCDLLGFSGITMLDLEAQEKLDAMDKQLEELRRSAGIAKNNRIEA